MSDTTNRQAYVFLQDGDVIQEGDEFTDGSVWRKSPLKGEPYSLENNLITRRLITFPTEQTDKLTVWDEYAIAYTQRLASVSVNAETSAYESALYANAMMKARAQK